jgi:hypothetical protein
MALLDDLRNTLQTRFAGNEPVLYAQDLGQPGEQEFTDILGVNELDFTAPQLGEVQDGKLNVTGKVSVFGLEALDFDLVIEENENEGQEQYLVFTLIPQSPLPATWEFSDSFPNLDGTYFDNLALSGVYLIATSFEHSIPVPSIDLAKGTNFLASAAPELALKSLKSLCPSVSNIVLQGIITRNKNVYGVDLIATVTAAPITIQSPFSLNLKHTPAQGNEQSLADFEGSITALDVNFPYSITIPTTNDPLDELQILLESRMQNDNLAFQDSDLGTATAADFFAYVGTHTLQITGASIQKQGKQLIVRGKTAIFNMPADTSVQIVVVENNERLDFTVMPVATSEDWKFSQSFSQVAGSFFDELQLSSVRLVATSYAHQLASVPGTLVEGLNFYAETTASGSLTRLSDLGNVFANSFPAQGTIIPSGALYEITLSYPVATNISFSLVTFGAVAIQQPVLYLSSIPDTANQPAINSAYISGAISMHPFEVYPARLIVPANDGQTNWELDQGCDCLNLPGISSLLSFYGQDNLAAIFPESLKQLEEIVVSKLGIIFLLGSNPMASVFTQIALSPAQDGAPRSWQILSSPKLTVNDLKLGINVSYYTYDAGGDGNQQLVFSCILSGHISIGNAADLTISLSIPLKGDWELVIAPENTALPTLNDIANFIWPTGGHSDNDLLAPLPQGLTSPDAALNISEIRIGFNPFTPSLSYFSFELDQEGQWLIIPNVLSVSGWSVAMKVDTTNGVSITGLLHGFVAIGSDTQSIANIEATLPIPAGLDGWTLCLEEGTTIEVPSFGDILALIGGQQFAQGLPNNLQSLGGLTVTLLEINFVPVPPSLNWFTSALNSRDEWILFENILSIQNIETNLDIRKRENSQYNTTGTISGTVFIFNKPIWIMSGRDDISKPWILKLATVQSVHIPGLAQLAGWMLPSTMLAYVPIDFMPFGQGFDLTDLNIGFDLSSMNLQKIHFHLENSEAWQVIPGYEYISVDQVEVEADLTNPFLGNQALVCHIAGAINLGNFGITLSADKSAPEAKWVLTGQLARQVDLNFEELFQKVLPASLSMPYAYGFPAAITITSASIRLIPDTAELHLQVSSVTDWQFSFALVALNINSINAKLDLESASDTSQRLYTLATDGNITFCGLSADLFFRISNKAEEDTVFTSVITPEQLQNISLPSIANALTTTDTSGNKWQTLVPTDFAQLAFSAGYVHINLTQNELFVYGNVTGFGSLVFLTKKLADQSWGYLLALALGPDFAFQNICSCLSVIDNILTVNNAGLFLSSFEDSSSDLMEDVRLVENFPEKPADLALPLPIENLPESRLQKGIYFYADLEFPAASLFGAILQIGNTATGLSNIIVSAFIAADNALNTIFMADLPDITVFNTVTLTHTSAYPGIHLKYTANNGNTNEFQLIGRLNLSLFSSLYSFDGSLVVDIEKIDSQLQLATDSATIEIPMPFGMPGICFTDLYVGVHYTFAKGTTPTLCTLLIGGSVSFGEYLSFSAYLQLKDATPALAVISLDRELSIGQFFAHCISTQWPNNFIDIVFLAGSKIYYYNQSADPNHQFNKDDNNYVYQNGFNVDANIVLTILIDIPISITASVIPDATGAYKGVIINAALTDTINLFVLRIAGTRSDSTGRFIGGPSFELNTVDDPMSFGFAAGLNFFREPFGLAEVKIRTMNGSDEMELLGHLESAESFAPFGALSLDFTYSQSAGFQIQNWPAFDMISSVIDFLDKIKDACNSLGETVCGQLSDMITDVVFQTKYTISPTFETQNNVLYFVLNGHYSLSLLNMDSPFVTVNFPPCMFALPNDLSLSALPGEITQSIANAAADFVMALLNDPQQISTFLAILFGTNAANIALQIACRGLIDSLCAEAASAAGEAVASLGGAVAAGAAAVSAAELAVGEILNDSSCFTAGTEVLLSDGTTYPIENIEVGDTLLGQNDTANTVLKHDQPLLGKRVLYSFNDGPYFVTAEHPFLTKTGWKSLEPSATARENPHLIVERIKLGDTLMLAGRKEVVLTSIKAKAAPPNTKLYNFVLEGGNTYFANNYLVHNKDESCFTGSTEVLLSNGTSKPIEAIMIGDILLGRNNAPNKVLKYDRPLLGDRALYAFNDGPYFVTAEHPFLTKSGWKSVDPEAAAKENSKLAVGKLGVGDILILAEGKEMILCAIKEKAADPNTPLYNFILEGNNTYFANSLLTHNKNPVDPQPTTPDFKSLSYSNGLVTAEWQGAYYASGYEFQFITASGAIYNALSADLLTLSTSFQVDNSLLTGICTGKVRSVHGSDKQSDWAQKSICKLDVPSGIQLSGSGNQLQATWNAVPPPAGNSGAITYAVQLIKDGNPVQSVETQMSSQAFEITDAGTYTAQVRALCSSNCIPSNYATSQTAISKLPTPATVSVSYSNTTKVITITWTGVQNCSGYAVEIASASSGIAYAQADALAADTSTTIAATVFTGHGGMYKARVAAKGAGAYLDSNFTVSENTVEKLMTPENITQNYGKADSKLIVRWNSISSSNITKYRLAIFDLLIQTQADASIDVVIPSGPEPANMSQQVDMGPLLTSAASEYRAQIQAIGNDTTIDSDTDVSSTTTIQLGAPQNITQTYTSADQHLVTYWETVQNATAYIAQVIDVGNGNRSVASKTINATAGNPDYIFTQQDFNEELNSLYQVRVQAIDGDQIINSAVNAGAAFPIVSLVLPDLALTFLNAGVYGKIHVCWTNNNPALLTYNLKLVDQHQNQIGAIVTNAISSAEFLLENAQNGPYAVMVQVKLGEYVSDWSNGIGIVVNLLAKPVNLNLDCHNNAITASWGAVAGATGYNVRILDVVSTINVDWDNSINASEWQQTFVSDVEGVVTNISFDRSSRPSTWSDPATHGTMFLYDDAGKLLGSSSFLDGNGRCSVAISGVVSKGKTYTCKIMYDSVVVIWYGQQNSLQALPLCVVQGMPYLDGQGTTPEASISTNTAVMNLTGLDASKTYYAQVAAIADNSESAWSDQAAVHLSLPPTVITAVIAGGVADSNGDGKGDNHSDQLPDTPVFQSAAINSSGGNGCRGTSRYVSKWNISSLNGYVIDSAQVVLSTCKGSVDTLDTFFYAITAESNGTLNDADFEAPNVQIPNATMGVPDIPAGTNGSFSFDLTSQLQDAVNQQHNIFSIQGRVNESLSGQQRGLQMYTTSNSSLATGNCPKLVVHSHSALISIVAGNLQSIPRTNPEVIPGGQAKFAPLKVKIADQAGKPVPNAAVAFSAGACPADMAVQIDPYGANTVTCTAGNDGIATLDHMLGCSVYGYYDVGDFNIIASIADGSKVTFSLNIAQTPPSPPLPNVTLAIISGDMQHQSRTVGSVPGGTACFQPLQVKIVDASGVPVSGAYVNFSPGAHPASMAVQVHPCGGVPATAITDGGGMATLNYMPGGTGVWCYYDKGQAGVIASVAGGPQVAFTLFVDN